MPNLLDYMRANERVLLTGPPGIAKTARVHATARQCDRRLIVSRAALSERIDYGGCLVPDLERGVTKALPLAMLQDLRTTEQPTLLFLDDLGQAPIDTQSAIMLLFDEGELSPNVLIWGATNRPGDKAGVSALCEPLRSRFHLAFAIPTPTSEDAPDGATLLHTWGEELAGWVDWAWSVNAPAEVVAWHRATSGTNLYRWSPHADPGVRMPDYRTWATVIRLIQAGFTDLHSISAAIGKPAAAEFLAFSRLAGSIPTPDQVRIDPHGAPVPAQDNPSALYLISACLAAAAKPADAGAFVTYLARMPRVFGALLGRDLYRKLGASLSGSKEWMAWFTSAEKLFNV